MSKDRDNLIIGIIVIAILLLLVRGIFAIGEVDSHALDKRPGAKQVTTTSYRYR